MKKKVLLTHQTKKMASLLALLLFIAGTGTAWSTEGTTGDAPAVVEAVGGADSATVATAGTTVGESTSGDAGPSEQSTEGETLPPSYNPFNYIVYKPLWILTNIVGDFNPVGKHIATPLEEAYPGLRFKGFVNSITQLNTTANTPVAGGARNKDWLLQKQEFRTQLELKYQYDDNLEFVNINNFSYDGAYDFQDKGGIYRDGSPNQVYYSQGKRIIKEAYLRGNYGTVNFTVGKQIVNWGKMDGKVIDIVNAADGRDVVDSHIGDYEWRAIGQWMANVAVRPVENITLNVLWNPDFQPNVGPAYGSPYWYPWTGNPPANTPHAANVTPSGFSHLSESEIGARVDSTIGALSFSGIYYNGFDRDPVSGKDGFNYYERLNKYGYALDYATSLLGQRLIIRSEGLYSVGRSFNTSDSSVESGIVKKDQLKTALACETSFFSDENKLDFLYQPIWTHNFDFDARTGQGTRNDFLHVINFGHNVRATNDKLSLGATFYISGGSVNTGWAANYTAGWKFNDYLKGTLAYNDYQGHNDQIPWGVYNKYKNVTIDVKYEW